MITKNNFQTSKQFKNTLREYHGQGLQSRDDFVNAKSTGYIQEPKAKVDFVRKHVTEPTQALKKFFGQGFFGLRHWHVWLPSDQGR